GLTAGETANVLVTCGMTFWVGFLTMGAVFFFLEPPELPSSVHLPFNSVASAGVFCVLAITAYLLSAVFVKKTIKIIKWKFPSPSIALALGQMVVGSLDWTCSGAALYLLLPPNSLSFPSFLAIYLLAQITGFASQVPGGLGVLETVVVLLLSPILPASDVLGAMLAFRLVYYLIPFVLGLLSFTLYEINRNKEGFKRALQILDRFAPDFLPHAFAFLTFLCGSLLFFSNATPEAAHRMTRLNELMPLWVLEGSHFLTGVAGALLLVSARGLQQRLQSAYVFSLVLLGIGVLGCLFKGFDFRESLVLLVVFGALLPCGHYFSRRTSLFQQRFPPFWVTAILFVLLGSVWTGVFSYRYEDYSVDLWSTFDLVEDSARFLRSTLGATLSLLLFSIIALLSPSQPETEFPGPAELDRAFEAAKKSRRATASLALLGDKALYFNRKNDAFLMYAIEGRIWIVLGDPVGEEKEREDLAIKFRDLCHRKKMWALFFLVDPQHFQFYLDMGLTVVKVGEEARVPLKSFKLDGTASADLRSCHQRFKEKEEYSFEVLPPGAGKDLLPELKRVSEEWLSKNKTREMGFSTGFYQEGYLQRFPLAVVRREGKVEAFANLLESGGKEEIMADLLRSSHEAPAALQDYLLLEAMLWAKDKGFKWFNLGTAPLLDVQESPLAPFKDKIAQILSPYSHVSSLADIRKEKERFNPEWSPQYLAASANLPLAVAIANTLALIAKGGRTGVKK
ncbi:MAG TPA: bifunctional lysylphosphatidylglycerol flippase/synthetase MprF, partial [bacterium]|nr:bifunctional lysylphosphatidylglycerol flippase/synthetase MprF [bacterium]